MEDTGWYMPNYELADDLKWGRGLGCDFALQSCLEWMETRRSKDNIRSNIGMPYSAIFMSYVNITQSHKISLFQVNLFTLFATK